MKRLIILIVFAASLGNLKAQKIYSTKTGRITFFSSTPIQDIEAKTSEVESKLASNGQIAFTLLIKGFQFPISPLRHYCLP